MVYYIAMLSLPIGEGGSGVWSITPPCFPCQLEGVGVGYGLLHHHAFFAYWQACEWGYGLLHRHVFLAYWWGGSGVWSIIPPYFCCLLPYWRWWEWGKVYYTAMFSLPIGGGGSGVWSITLPSLHCLLAGVGGSGVLFFSVPT